jgi:hypothetical protein
MMTNGAEDHVIAFSAKRKPCQAGLAASSPVKSAKILL